MQMLTERGQVIFCEEPGCGKPAAGSHIDVLNRAHLVCQEHNPYKLICPHCGKAQ